MTAVLKLKQQCETAPALLGVEHSARGYRWIERLDPSRELAATGIAQAHGLPELLGRVLAARGANAQTAACYLDPSIRTLLPDPVGTLEATRILVEEGFHVLVYCSDDPRMAVRLEEAGATAVMPAGSPIGSGQGVLNPNNIRITKELCRVPILVDAGVGTASDAAIAMELGCDAVIVNTAIAQAKDPIRMARAMKHAVIAGREAYLAGRMAKKRYADPSSPLGGLI